MSFVKHILRRHLALALVLSSLFTSSLAQLKSPPHSLVDIQSGKQVEFEQLWNERPVLIVFYSSTCPLCKNYTKSIKELEDRFGNDIEIALIFSGKLHDKKSVELYLKEYQLSTRTVLDKKFKMADFLDASVTPEVFLLFKGEIRYQGAIDDWVIQLGKTKKEVEKHYLEDAIESLLNGKTIENSSQKAIGCFIR